VLRLSNHLSRTSESHGHYQIYDSSAAFLFEVPEQSSPLVLQELQIGGTSRGRHLGGRGSLCESQLQALRLHDTFHGSHSADNVDVRPTAQAKIDGAQGLLDPEAAAFDLAQQADGRRSYFSRLSARVSPRILEQNVS
jgi:hypothetical protein